MSVEENKAVVLRYFLETHNPPYTLDVIDETCTPAYAKRRWSWLRIERTAFPDASYTIDDVIAEGDKMVLRVSFTSTHSGPFGPRSVRCRPLGSAAPIRRPGSTMAIIGKSGILRRDAHGRLAPVGSGSAVVNLAGRAVTGRGNLRAAVHVRRRAPLTGLNPARSAVRGRERTTLRPSSPTPPAPTVLGLAVSSGRAGRCSAPTIGRRRSSPVAA